MKQWIKVFLFTFSFLSLGAEEVDFSPMTIEGCDDQMKLSIGDVIEYTILNQPRIQSLIQDVRRDQGFVQELAGPFDPVTTFEYDSTFIGDAQTVGIKTRQSGKINRAALTETKQFRLGTAIALNLEINQVEDPAELFTPRYNEGFVSFDLIQPLLRGFRNGFQVSQEKASTYQLRATYYNSLHAISEVLLETINRYWDVVRDQKLLEVRKGAVERFENLVQMTQRLIDEEQIAKSEINQPLGQLANERINFVVAKQSLYTSIQILKVAMGDVDLCNLDDSILFAIDNLPSYDEEIPICENMNILTKSAISNRYDLQALNMQEEQFRVLSSGAKNEMLPELNLVYRQHIIDHTLDQKSRAFFSSYEFPFPEKSSLVGVTISFPFCNDQAKGLYKQYRAQAVQTQYLSVELQQQILSSVMDSWMSYIRLKNELANAKNSVEKFGQLVKDEHTRLSEGLGSLFNLVQFETNLTDAMVTYITIQSALAQNVANIHFLTGLLLKQNSNLCLIDVNNIIDLPSEVIK